MSVQKVIKEQLRSVIEWTNPPKDLLVYKWSENGDEIKNASKLLVSSGQADQVSGKIEQYLVTFSGSIEHKPENRQVSATP